MHCALVVEMMLLNNSLAVTKSAVLVLTLPSYLTQSPPTVHLTQCGTSFSGWWAQTMRRYVAFLCWGMAEMGMKNMVLVPGVLPCPCASQWILVALDACHNNPSELLLSSLYSASSPVSGLKALPWSAASVGGLV